MDVQVQREGASARVAVSGSLNTNTASQLEGELEPLFGEVTEIAFDFSDLDYISSAGLRVIMMTFKRLGGTGVSVAGASDEVREVFDITGFSGLFEVK